MAEAERERSPSGADREPREDNPMPKRLYTPDDFSYAFSTSEYLKDFYKDKVEEPAMQLVIWFLPSMLFRLPKQKRLLDFGAGPTVHVAMMARNKVDQIFLSDYLQQNRDELVRWVRGASDFRWEPVAKMISIHENTYETDGFITMEEETRKKVKGVLYCDMHRANAVPGADAHFDIVTTFFCVEYACLQQDQYRQAVANIVQAVKPGGYFIMGGVMEETWCAFGGRKFACLYLTEDLVMDSVRDAGIDVENKTTFSYVTQNGIFLLCGQRHENEPSKQTRG